MTAPAAAALRRNSVATSAREGEGEARRRWWRTRGSSEAARTRRRQAQRRRPCWPRSGTRAQALESERERAGSGEGDGEGVLVPLLIGSRAQGAWPKVGRAAAAEAHGGHVQGACRPLGRFREQLAGDDGISVGRDFGLFPGRIRTWAEYEDRSPHEALRFSLRHSSHLSNITVGN